MKWVFRLLTLGSLGFALLVPFFIKDGAGDPMWSVPGLKSDQGGATLHTLPEDERIRQVYKWKDKNGQWHYSDALPPDDSPVQQISVSNTANIIQSVKVDVPEEIQPDGGRPRQTQKQQETMQRLEGDSPLTVDRLKNILNDTQSVKEMMESRNAALEDISGGRE